MRRLVCTLVLLGSAACGSDADVAGNYTVALTNRSNGCSLGSWTVGSQSTAMAVVVQEDSNVTLTVQGAPSFVLASVLGTSTFRGGVDDDTVSLAVTGTAAMNNGICAYTYNARIKAVQSGDTMTGRIEYRAATNGGSDCGSREGCVSFQDFNGTRPPP